jgi:hypothetical protein
MIVASLLLVIAAAVTLLIGLFQREQIEWVFASIGSCLLAGLLLTIGVLRSRPSRKPVLQSGGQGQGASWAGASTWGGSGDGGEGGAAVLTRDEDDVSAGETAPLLRGDDEPTRTGLVTSPPADPDALWAPGNDDDTGDVRVVPPPAPETAEAPAEPEPAADPDDDVVVVPKPSARTGGDSGLSQPPPAVSSAPTGATAAAASGGTDEAARFEQVLSPIAGVGPAKRTALYLHFGTYRKLRAATPEKLAEVPGISRTLADRIHTTLHSK